LLEKAHRINEAEDPIVISRHLPRHLQQAARASGECLCMEMGVAMGKKGYGNDRRHPGEGRA
jgi:hypothetical protein